MPLSVISKSIITWSIATLLLVSCVSTAPTTPKATEVTAVVTTPEFTATTGALSMTVLNAATNKAIRGYDFYLAQLLPVPDAPEGIFVASLDITTAPRGSSSEAGYLSISNVPPGKYAVIILWPNGTTENIKTQSGDHDFVVEIKPNSLTELSTVSVMVSFVTNP